MASGRRRRGRGADGQILVLFAMALVGIMAAAGLAFDIGRFYSEKRYLQNAADAGALAVANALIRGESTTDAEAEGRDVLTRNLMGSPTGTVASVALTPTYEAGHAGDPAYLSSGILISGGDVRVAIKSDVTYTFGRAVGLTSAVVGGKALVKTKGDLLPIAVRHYINAPGPFAGAVAPCDGNTNHFQDLVATANTACLGSTTDASLRSTPNPGLPFNPTTPDDDPVNHGPIIALVGLGASPSNAASFRGFVALDVRNFQFDSPPSNVFYNGVTAGTNQNTLKDIEAAWVATGYPGPDFPVVTVPPDPNDQVGIIDGNSSGIIVDAINARYDPGAEILAAVYSGTVSNIPDFSYAVPSTATINTNQTRNNAITMSVTKNDSFAGQVFTSSFANWGEPAHPWGTTLTPLTFSPSPMTPNGTVAWSTFETTGAPAGVYTVWIKGHSPSPALIDHFYPVGISIGSVNRDFSLSGGAAVLIASTGGSGTTGVTVSTPNTNGAYFGGDVTLSVEGGPDALVPGTLPTGIGAVSVSPSTITLNKGTSETATVSINGGALGPGVYTLTLRVTGTNSTGQPVTRMVPISVAIATASTTDEYVDILGFTTFRITSVDANTVYGYAISGVYADMNDPALRRGQVARLVPWD